MDLTGNDKSFIVTSFYLLEVAHRATTLFKSSRPALKARLLRFLVSNLEVNGKNLSIKLKTPFDTIAECSQNDNWLPIHDSIRNLSFEYQVDDNYLKDFMRRLGLAHSALANSI